MKKLLGAALSLALLFPSGPASAELFKNLAITGSIDVRAISGENIEDFNSHQNDHIGTVQTRTMVNAKWDLLDDVHSTITLRKSDRTWGTAGGDANSPSQQNNQVLVGNNAAGVGAPNGGVASNIAVQQANVKIDKVFGAYDVTIGRQYYGEAGDFVAHFGPKGSAGMYVTAPTPSASTTRTTG